MDVEVPNRNVDLLFNFFAKKMQLGLAAANDKGYEVAIFEAWRSPQRQAYLFAQGRTRPGKIVTKSKPWQSWHQFGLACDLAFRRNGQWSWDGDMTAIHPIFHELGLETLSFEDGHFQFTAGIPITTAYETVREHGMQQLWSEIMEDK